LTITVDPPSDPLPEVPHTFDPDKTRDRIQNAVHNALEARDRGEMLVAWGWACDAFRAWDALDTVASDPSRRVLPKAWTA
jgi:hypothetical protein